MAIGRSNRYRGAILVPLAFLAVARAAGAQSPPRLPPLLDEAEEIRMARSAAPPSISGDADIWVLRRGGHVKVRTGTSGVACIVQRDHPDSLYPICYDAEGARTILPIAVRRQQLREKGMAADRIEAEISAAIERGELNVPEHAAVSWMQSPHQVIFAGPDGERVGTWKPHIMIHIPGLTADRLGVTMMPDGDFMIQEPGRPTAHLIVISREWAAGDGGV